MSMSSRSGSTTSGTSTRSAECDLGGLARAREAGVHAGVERDVRHLLPEAPRLLLAAVGQRDLPCRVAVDATLHVQDGLPVPGEDEEAHG